MKYSAFLFIPFALFIFLSFSFKPNDNGAYKQKEYYDTGCNCFVRELYHPNGKLFSYEQYVDSINWIRNGMSIYFYENGDTADITHFVNGSEEGYAYSKYESGVVSIERYYRKGICDSTKWYEEDGSLKEVTIYSNNTNENNQFNRIEKYYAKGGRLIYTEQYDNYRKIKTAIIDSALYIARMDSLANRTGEQLFKANCASCHNPYKDATGPKLAGITKRRTEKWIRNWIYNPAVMIARGDKQAVAIYNKWYKTSMTAFPNLSKKEMDKLIDYLKSL